MNIHIRHSEKADIDAIRALYAQPSVYSNTLQTPFPSQEKWENVLGQHNPHFTSLVAVTEGEIAGQLGMEVFHNPRRKHVANIGMGVHAKWRRRGVGSALLQNAIDLAENWLAIRRIEIEVYTDNDAAIALYQRFGFQKEGTAPDYAFRNGSYMDVHLMARLAQRTAEPPQV